MNFGFVYIATNESFKNLQKIGFTSRNPTERMSELDSTGVPTPFKISYLVCLKDPFRFEQIIHEKLSEFRKRDSREFFEIKLTDAINVLKELISEHNIEIKFEEFDEDAFQISNIDKNTPHEYIDKYNHNEKNKDELQTRGIDDEWLRRENIKKLVNSDQVDTSILEVLTRFDPKEIAEYYFNFIRYGVGSVEIFSDSYGYNEEDEEDKKSVESLKLHFLSLYQVYELKTKISGVDSIENEMAKWLPFIFNYFENTASSDNRSHSLYMKLRSLFDVFDFLLLQKLQFEVFRKFSELMPKTNFIFQYNYARMLYILGNTDEAIKNLNWYMLLSEKECDFKNFEQAVPICKLYVSIMTEQETIQNKETKDFLVSFCENLIRNYENSKSSISKSYADYFEKRTIPILRNFILGQYGDIKIYKDPGKYLKIPLSPMPAIFYKKK
jgi:hypothetical protein